MGNLDLDRAKGLGSTPSEQLNLTPTQKSATSATHDLGNSGHILIQLVLATLFVAESWEEL